METKFYQTKVTYSWLSVEKEALWVTSGHKRWEHDDHFRVNSFKTAKERREKPFVQSEPASGSDVTGTLHLQADSTTKGVTIKLHTHTLKQLYTHTHTPSASGQTPICQSFWHLLIKDANYRSNHAHTHTHRTWSCVVNKHRRDSNLLDRKCFQAVEHEYSTVKLSPAALHLDNVVRLLIVCEGTAISLSFTFQRHTLGFFGFHSRSV